MNSKAQYGAVACNCAHTYKPWVLRFLAQVPARSTVYFSSTLGGTNRCCLTRASVHYSNNFDIRPLCHQNYHQGSLQSWPLPRRRPRAYLLTRPRTFCSIFLSNYRKSSSRILGTPFGDIYGLTVTITLIAERLSDTNFGSVRQGPMKTKVTSKCVTRLRRCNLMTVIQARACRLMSNLSPGNCIVLE